MAGFAGLAEAGVGQIAAKASVLTLTQSTTKTALSIGVAPLIINSLRGGATASTSDAAAFDLTRTGIRLEGLSSYGVISALIMNASMRVFSMTPAQINKKDISGKNNKLENTIKIMFLFFVSLSILTGFYTTVVFTLFGLYSKTALGMEKDDAFVTFFMQTKAIRSLAFDSFLISLVSFTASFCLSIFLLYDGKLRWYASGSSSILLTLSILNWRKIIDIAGNILFVEK